MSITSPQTGGERQPSTKPVAGAKPTTSGKPGRTPSGGAFGGGATPPVKVRREASWGPIVLFTTAGLIAVLIIAFAGYQVWQSGRGWQAKAGSISGIVNFRTKAPGDLTRVARYGPISYPQNPPVGGDHNPNWQRCLGDVYDKPIANEHAVASLELGAVWITYKPDLPAAQVATLAAKVTGNDFLLMSPYPGLDSPISVQAWGYQLKVNNAGDSRIDDFIKDLKENASMQQGGSCSAGSFITATGTVPHDRGSPAPGASGATPSTSGSAAPAAPSSSASAAPSKS